MDGTLGVEDWASIERYAGYRFSFLGKIQTEWRSRGLKGAGRKKSESYRSGQWRDMKLIVGSHGYLRVTLNDNCSRRKQLMVHRLILEAFNGPCPEGMQCRHLDGDKLNCHVSNLAWGSAKENGEDKVRHHSDRKGVDHYCAKLSEEDVAEILRLIMNGVSRRKIAARFGVALGSIGCIRSGRSWKHVPRPSGFPDPGDMARLPNGRWSTSDPEEARR